VTIFVTHRPGPFDSVFFIVPDFTVISTTHEHRTTVEALKNHSLSLNTKKQLSVGEPVDRRNDVIENLLEIPAFAL
jgi:hypothetical protein